MQGAMPTLADPGYDTYLRGVAVAAAKLSNSTAAIAVFSVEAEELWLYPGGCDGRFTLSFRVEGAPEYGVYSLVMMITS